MTFSQSRSSDFFSVENEIFYPFEIFLMVDSFDGVSPFKKKNYIFDSADEIEVVMFSQLIPPVYLVRRKQLIGGSEILGTNNKLSRGIRASTQKDPKTE